MAIQFEFYETPDPTGEKQEKYHVRVVTTKTVSTSQISAEVQDETTLTESDIKAVLASLSKSIAYHLGNSERVHLEGIGYFQPTLAHDKEIDPNKTRSQSIWFKSVKFRADQELKNRLKFVQTERSEIKRHSTKLSVEEIDRKLEEYFSENDFITRRRFEVLCGMTQSTTMRHIRRLVQEGKIRNINTLRQPVYVPVARE